MAYFIWREEGCPHGRHLAHWQIARDLVAVEEGYERAAAPDTAAPEPAPKRRSRAKAPAKG